MVNEKNNIASYIFYRWMLRNFQTNRRRKDDAGNQEEQFVIGSRIDY